MWTFALGTGDYAIYIIYIYMYIYIYVYIYIYMYIYIYIYIYEQTSASNLCLKYAILTKHLPQVCPTD
jgi:hypothetical protein